MNLAALADQHAPGDRALHAEGRWHTWGEVRRRARPCAGALAELGVRPDDRVAIVWPTSVDFVVAYLGILAAGAVAVPLNPNSPPNELVRELERGRARGHARRSRRRVPFPWFDIWCCPSAVGATGATGSGALIWEDSRPRPGRAYGARSRSPVRSAEASCGRGRREDSDLAVLLFTSGTAGEPKAAMLTHGNLVANLRQMLAHPRDLPCRRRRARGLAAVPHLRA